MFILEDECFVAFDKDTGEVILKTMSINQQRAWVDKFDNDVKSIYHILRPLYLKDEFGGWHLTRYAVKLMNDACRR
jgi:hypothetical protein